LARSFLQSLLPPPPSPAFSYTKIYTPFPRSSKIWVCPRRVPRSQRHLLNRCGNRVPEDREISSPARIARTDPADPGRPRRSRRRPRTQAKAFKPLAASTRSLALTAGRNPRRGPPSARHAVPSPLTRPRGSPISGLSSGAGNMSNEAASEQWRAVPGGMGWRKTHPIIPRSPSPRRRDVLYFKIPRPAAFSCSPFFPSRGCRARRVALVESSRGRILSVYNPRGGVEGWCGWAGGVGVCEGLCPAAR